MPVLQRRQSSGSTASNWLRNPLKRNSDALPPAPKDEHRTSFPPTVSILPDSMNVAVDGWDAVPLPAHHRFFPLHNPVGPRVYYNVHLIPPSQIRPGARPPSVFSPSFPAMRRGNACTTLPFKSHASRIHGTIVRYGLK
ncbi:hypothetical protein AGABI2DRAFT_113788 [Agaricus bisporus var. bisporus H97]|uniref:hypothetical protein n=1 Tax=Agaricus bisporus var. bisporus (strain H97 / ATCC MYA-4626 / FGSC 10389) TaxID=936046 RepID=UPI00029F7D2D|nr:hypothetical protein AGABI2DRAFT_113788 [Agaricus bisporus var. bisporus H97]EKV51042.1 hypothetical protein AGABI2DRAFT_113788 [Agaricus bisporus var. bisporus H97]